MKAFLAVALYAVLLVSCNKNIRVEQSGIYSKYALKHALKKISETNRNSNSSIIVDVTNSEIQAVFRDENFRNIHFDRLQVADSLVLYPKFLLKDTFETFRLESNSVKKLAGNKISFHAKNNNYNFGDEMWVSPIIRIVDSGYDYRKHKHYEVRRNDNLELKWNADPNNKMGVAVRIGFILNNKKFETWKLITNIL